MKGIQTRWNGKVSKIGRNEKCPCGSGNKYKKCCIDRNLEIKLEPGASNNYNPFGVDVTENRGKNFNDIINSRINNLYNKIFNMSYKEKLDEYIGIIDWILEHCVKHKIKNVKQFDSLNIMDEYLNNLIYNLIEENYNVTVDDYDLNVIINHLDKILLILEHDLETYSNLLRSKANLLFKLGDVNAGEKLLLDYLENNPNDGFIYVELVDNFKDVDDLIKSKYYYELGLGRDKLSHKEVLEERSYYFD